MDEEIRPTQLFPRLVVAMGVLLALCAAAYLATLAPPYDRWDAIVGRDFVNMWTGARATLAGNVERLFDHRQFLEEIRRAFPGASWRNWSYPPHVLLFVWPLGLLPYMAAWALWSLAGLALYLLVAAGGVRSAKTLAGLAAAPAVGVNLFFGQNGFFSAALIIGAVRELDRRPLVAGVCLGLLTVKPQLGVLFPLALILSGRWRCLAAAAATAAVLALVTAAIFGPQVWRDYVEKVVPYQSEVMTRFHGPFLAMMPTAFATGRLWNTSTTVAWMFQAPFTIFALAAVTWTFIKRRESLLSAGVLVTASFVITPYVYVYDMVVLGWVIAILHRPLSRGSDQMLAACVWLVPVVTIACGFVEYFNIPAPPVAPFLMAAFLGRLLMLLRRPEGAA